MFTKLISAFVFTLLCGHAMAEIFPEGSYKNADGVRIDFNADRTATFTASVRCVAEGKIHNSARGLLFSVTKRKGLCPLLLGAVVGIVRSESDKVVQWKGIAQSLKPYNGVFIKQGV